MLFNAILSQHWIITGSCNYRQMLLPLTTAFRKPGYTRGKIFGYSMYIISPAIIFQPI